MTRLKKSNGDKTQIVTKHKYTNCDKTQKLKWWKKSKTQIVTKLKIENCEIAQKLNLWKKKNSKTDCNKTKTKSYCDKNKKKNKMVKKSQKIIYFVLCLIVCFLFKVVTKLKKSNCDRT